MRKVLNNLEENIAVIVLIAFTCMSSPVSMMFFNHKITGEAAAVGINDKQIRGGGNGSITCPDSSSRQASIAFFVYQNNSNQLPTGRWNINELSNSQNSPAGFVSGSFNSTEINPNTYTLMGKKIYEVQLCSLPLSIPVTINGQCGQHVTINVKFDSSDPLVKTGGAFSGDVICTSSSSSSLDTLALKGHF